MTDAAASVTDAQRAPADQAGFALYVGLQTADVEGRARLADLAQAVMTLVAEIGSDAVIHSALALGARGSHGQLVARLRDQLAAQVPTSARTPASASASARARAAWTRTSPVTNGSALVVDLDAREVTIDGSPVPFTFKELALLEYLLRAPHRAVSRDELFSNVWLTGAPSEGTRTIDVHVRRLREKLGGCLQIVTVRGVGYRCEPTPEIVLVGSGDAG